LGDARLEGGAGKLLVGLEANAGVVGFFLPQLSQSALGILKALLVEHPGKAMAEMENRAAKTSVVRRRLFRMANASLISSPTRDNVRTGSPLGIRTDHCPSRTKRF
jgi:hypothetical protein